MATFTVTNLFNAGAGSLRNAIFQANTASTTDFIDFDTSLSSGTINLTSGQLRIRDDLTINGLGANLLSVDAGGNSSVFYADDGDFGDDLEVVIKGLTITGGDGYGGGIFNQENLTITNSTISDNTGFNGGGIQNQKNLTITNSTISGNSGTYGGGGIFNQENLTITNSTISGNSGRRGGIDNYGGFLTVSNSTISNNTGDGDTGGGGISNYYSVASVSNSTISGNTGRGGIFNYNSTLTVSNSIISDNADGSGISNFGDNGARLTVTNSTISGTIGGSGISNSSGYRGDGIVTVTDSTISGNTANFGGGGISNSGGFGGDGIVTVTDSTISGNTAGNFGGGGIDNSGSYGSDGIVTVTNSTISGNTANFGGGGIDNSGFYYGDGIVTVTNSTISGNTADEGSISGINNNSDDKSDGTVTVTSSIIAANADNEDLGGNDPFTSEGNNLIGNGDGAAGFTNGVNGDLVGTTANPIDPLLGELQNNGGPTQTQALLPGSPAINAGSNPLNLQFDQRGPGFDRVVGAQADVGAYEVVPEPDSTLGVLGVAVLGVVLMRKRQRQQKTEARCGNRVM